MVTPQDKYSMPIPEELFDSIGDSNNCGFEARLEPDCGRYEGSQKNSIPWKQQVMGMACDAFWIKRMHLSSFSESWTRFLKGQISLNAT